jgi:hypothetical protein
MELYKLLVYWLRDELPLAKYESKGDGHTFKICKLISKEPFKEVEVVHVHISPNWMMIGGGLGLEEEVAITEKSLRFGKWCSNVELDAADPKFFTKVAFYMTWAARITTMGAFAPADKKRTKKEIKALKAKLEELRGTT